MEDRVLGFRQLERLETFLHSVQPRSLSQPMTCLFWRRGRWKYSFNPFTTSAVQGSECLAPCSGHFTPDGVKWPGRLCGIRGRSERARKISPAHWVPRVISPGSERYECEADHLSSLVPRLGRVTTKSAVPIYSMVLY